MTDKTHPITPPPELVEQWVTEAKAQLGPFYDYIATQAARWGADQELEASVAWLISNNRLNPRWGRALQEARRPKPPSLKAQALETLAEMREGFAPDLQDLDLLRLALEQLDD